jgi:hypothetical protein
MSAPHDFIEIELDINGISSHLFRDITTPPRQNIMIFSDDSDIPTLYEVLLQLMSHGITKLFNVSRVNFGDITPEQVDYINRYFAKIGFKMHVRSFPASELPSNYTNNNSRYLELAGNLDLRILETDERLRFRMIDNTNQTSELMVYEISWKFCAWN